MASRINADDELGEMSEINVTPLVDVMLVLLIIFMVTAPMLTQGLTVELPGAEGKAYEQSATQPSTISITRQGAVYIDRTPLGNGNLEVTLGSALRGRGIRKALLEADRSVPYGKVIEVMDIMNRAGVEQLGMVTKPRDESGRQGQ